MLISWCFIAHSLLFKSFGDDVSDNERCFSMLISWCFITLSLLFKSFGDDGRVIMKGTVQ